VVVTVRRREGLPNTPVGYPDRNAVDWIRATASVSNGVPEIASGISKSGVGSGTATETARSVGGSASVKDGEAESDRDSCCDGVHTSMVPPLRRDGPGRGTWSGRTNGPDVGTGLDATTNGTVPECP
jgi:hypothetical protein